MQHRAVDPHQADEQTHRALARFARLLAITALADVEAELKVEASESKIKSSTRVERRKLLTPAEIVSRIKKSAPTTRMGESWSN